MSEGRRSEGQSEGVQRTGRSRMISLLLLMAVVAGFALYRSPVLRVDEVQVTGNSRLTPERVLEAAQIDHGDFRWLHMGSAVTARLKREPWIETAKARWSLTHLEIEVTERQPLSLVPYQGKWLSLDEEGVILDLVESPSAMKLPVVAGARPERALRGDQLSDPSLGDALLLLKFMSEPFRNQVAEVQVESDRTLVLFMVQGPQVLWGRVPIQGDRVADVRSKLESLGEFWPQIPKQKMKDCRIDLRIQNRLIHAGCQ